MHALLRIAFVLGLVVGYAGCGSKSSTPAKTNTVSSGNPITAPLDYVGAAGKAKVTAEKVIDTTSLARQIQMFYAAEGRYPADLAEMVREKYMPNIPPPPAGMRYEYNAANGEVKLLRK